MRMGADLWDLGWIIGLEKKKVSDPNGTVMLFSWCAHNTTRRTTVFFDFSRTLIFLPLSGRCFM